MFEHKPWVETMVANLGLPHVQWTYVADEEQYKVRRLLAEGPVLLRMSRSAGGAGFARVDDSDHLAESWPHNPEAFVSVTPFLEQATPINIGATVWHDGVTISHPSVQLIGIPECTTRPFGYCGNDFGLARELDVATIDAIETSVRTLGRWLRQYGYLGTFGADFLVHEGTPLFTEINARFQGSTRASSQLSSEAGESCLFLDHIAAMLGGSAPGSRPLRDIARSMPTFGNVVVHWTGIPAVLDSSHFVSAAREQSRDSRVDVAAKPTVTTETGGVLARLTVRAPITRSGFELTEPWGSLVRASVAAADRQASGAREKAASPR